MINDKRRIPMAVNKIETFFKEGLTKGNYRFKICRRL